MQSSLTRASDCGDQRCSFLLLFLFVRAVGSGVSTVLPNPIGGCWDCCPMDFIPAFFANPTVLSYRWTERSVCSNMIIMLMDRK
ncbi:uncharacterized protein BDW47DRAFT_112889 [Aspergillus candidus]|uniref:Secreted protein n=1 Tax=Aspergillus candidus TaxID=41067 RepID=A0A2I2F099_ASPCN|nr:hypothetical protein BDW47DRAFT_112889 [Aspergillus candidus]PLB34049.1 hypothetical protein BDW47DRAFT_112889 [Aspergillus candidus]